MHSHLQDLDVLQIKSTINEPLANFLTTHDGGILESGLKFLRCAASFDIVSYLSHNSEIAKLKKG